ncbi:MAG: ammonium transporter [Deltaproteobacteria bacterium]|nr:ammonium transporter [Deltaproteobacteria bacterium]
MRRMKPILILFLLMASMAPRALWAGETSLGDIKVMVDSLWVMVAGMMVFFMNTGFAMLESGLCQSKNSANILAKNFIVFAIASISFWVIGWGLMFGNGTPYYGHEGLFMLSGADNSPATGDAYAGAYGAINWTGVPLYVKFFFQLVFAATAATIVSGVVAERIKFIAFIVFSFLLVAFLYPVTGHWIWGGGWLGSLGFWDFAGSTVVHSVGGWAALAGCLLLGPRKGKYGKDGKINPIQGHSLNLATLGALILWLGWFGFNPGSTMAADGELIGRIAVVTNAAAAAGVISATAVAWIVLGKPDLSMILNGCLAGLVAITAPCAWVSVSSALIIGAIAGVFVVFSIIMFDKLKLDDPVGAFSVHLVNGIWGTLSLGLFAQKSFDPANMTDGLFFGGGAGLLGTQFIGVIAVGAFTFIGSFIFWGIIKAVMGIRVTEEEEIEGLDAGEHGNRAYPDFVLTTPHGHGR